MQSPVIKKEKADEDDEVVQEVRLASSLWGVVMYVLVKGYWIHTVACGGGRLYCQGGGNSVASNVLFQRG